MTHSDPHSDPHSGSHTVRDSASGPDSTPPDPEILRAYLLGRLPDAERDALEVLLLADGDVHAAALEAETDLLDDYVGGHLDGADRQAFEAHVLPRPEIAQRVTAARGIALWAEGALAGEASPKAAARPLETRRGAEREGFAGWLGGLLAAPGLRPALAAALMLLFAAVGFLTWRMMEMGQEMAGLHRTHEGLVEERNDIDRDRAALTEELAAVRRDLAAAESEGPGDEIDAAALTTARQRIAELEEALETERSGRRRPPSPRRVEVAHLLTLATRDAGVPTLDLPAGPGRLTLHLDAGLEGDYYESFQARLLGPGGEEVWSRTGLTADADSGTVDLTLPAQAVEPGRYEVLLEGLEAGEADLVGAYEVDIRRP